MPWNDQSNGGGQGPWGGGGSGQGGGGGPWGQGPRGGGPQRGGGGGQPPPDLEDLMRQLQKGVGGLFGGKGGKSGGTTPVFVLVALAALVWIAWPGSGWYIVRPEQQGVILRFGDFHRADGPGFHLKFPVPIETALLPNVQELQSVTIGGIDDSNRNRRQSVSATDSLMLTGDENIVDLSFVVQWVINTERTADYLFNVDDPFATVRDVSEAAMREVVGQTALQPIISNDIQGVANRVQERIQETLDYYEAGITITGVLVERPTLPSSPNPGASDDVTQSPLAAFRDVENAQQEREKAIQDARAYANQVIPEARGAAEQILEQARGYREAVIAESAGDAARFLSIYEQYRLAPVVTRQRMFLETMELVLANSEKVILDENGEGTGVVPFLPLNEFTRQRTGAN